MQSYILSTNKNFNIRIFTANPAKWTFPRICLGKSIHWPQPEVSTLIWPDGPVTQIEKEKKLMPSLQRLRIILFLICFLICFHMSNQRHFSLNKTTYTYQPQFIVKKSVSSWSRDSYVDLKIILINVLHILTIFFLKKYKKEVGFLNIRLQNKRNTRVFSAYEAIKPECFKFVTLKCHFFDQHIGDEIRLPQLVIGVSISADYY